MIRHENVCENAHLEIFLYFIEQILEVPIICVVMKYASATVRTIDNVIHVIAEIDSGRTRHEKYYDTSFGPLRGQTPTNGHYEQTLQTRQSEIRVSMRLMSRGKADASLTFGTSSILAVKRSKPVEQPPCGGRPYLNACR